ncbi:regulator of chromosome condensation 1/beta-lactamase-inhibitor protein II, partial [Phakopsora pachyrhizi]
VDVVKRPSVVHFLKRTKFFKDLKLHERYGAAVDQAGDLFLWGPEVTKTDESVPILEGYDIRQIACTTHKLYALSRKGQVYVLDISQRDFDDVKSSSKYSNWYWLGSWLGYHQPLRKRGIQILQVDPSDRPLDRRESFTSIAAGDNHLLALTSDGRTFASPVNLDANDHGQLGVKRVRINYSESQSESIELAPTAIEDFMHTNKQRLKQNQARITQQLKLSSEQQVDQPPPESEDSHTTSDPPKPSARDTTVQSSTFCTILHEIPELRSANVIDIACGSSHSLVRTSSGEVYGFGANQFGQIGAGPQLIFSGLISPTKTRLSDSQGTVTKCVSIAAGGDLSFFVIESLEPKRGSKSVDVLACGNGQFGGIGNGQWMNQATPTRVKTISGLTEWSESEKKTKPIGIHSISVGKNHVAVVLDNLINMDGKEFGRDVLIWGQGSEYQIGNQKRTNLSIPQHVSPLNVIPSPKPEKMIFNESLIKSGTESPMPHSRLQLRGKRKVGKVLVEQAVVTGWGTTGVYWKIV